MKFKITFKDLSPLYVLSLFFIFYGIQSFRAGWDPSGYFGFLIGLWILFSLPIYQRYKVEIQESGLFIRRMLFPALFIPWTDIREIQYKRPTLQPKRIFLKYINKEKTKEIYFLKYLFSRPDLIQEISNRTNIPLPEKYIKFRNKLERNYRRNEIIWGILLIPVTLAAGWSYLKTIPYGLSFDNWTWNTITWLFACLFMSYLVNQFDYHPSPKRDIQGWCYIAIFLSMICTPNILIYFNDTWVYFGYGILFIGVFFFNLLLFVPDSRYHHQYIVPIFLISFLLVWQGPMFLIPRAPTQELNFQKSFADYSFTPDGSLCHYSNQSIYFDHPKNGKEEVYPFLQETTESYNHYSAHWSPDNQKFVYQSYDDQGTTQAIIYIFNYPTKQYRKIFSQDNFALGTRYYPRFKYFYYNWSPDSRYFVFASPLYCRSTTPPEYDVMMYDSRQETTRKIYHSKELITDIWWAQDTTLYYLTYKEKKPGKGVILHYYTLWKAQPVFSMTGQWVSLQTTKITEFDTPWNSVYPVFQGNYLYLREDKGDNQNFQQYFYSIKKKKKIIFPGRIYFCMTPLRNESFHPLEEKVLYAVDTENRGILYEFDLKTGKSREVIREKEYIEEPSYSYDGKRIAYVATERLLGSMISIKSDGTDWRKVSPTIVPDVLYSLSPIHCWNPKNNTLYVELVAFGYRRDENRIKRYLVNLNDKK